MKVRDIFVFVFVFVFVNVGIISSAVDGLDLVGDDRVARVESEEILKSWVINDGDGDFTDKLVDRVKKVFGFVTDNSAFDDLRSIKNGKMACAGDFVDSVTSSNACGQ